MVVYVVTIIEGLDVLSEVTVCVVGAGTVMSHCNRFIWVYSTCEAHVDVALVSADDLYVWSVVDLLAVVSCGRTLDSPDSVLLSWVATELDLYCGSADGPEVVSVASSDVVCGEPVGALFCDSTTVSVGTTGTSDKLYDWVCVDVPVEPSSDGSCHWVLLVESAKVFLIGLGDVGRVR